MITIVASGLPRQPRFDPPTSLGFRRGIPLDGLSNCYYRCLEAYVRAAGVRRHEAADALVHPLDFRPADVVESAPHEDRRRLLFLTRNIFSPCDEFPSVRCEWHEAADVDVRVLLHRIAETGPVLMRPSPDHCLLTAGGGKGLVRLLDTELRSDTGFVREARIDDRWVDELLTVGVPTFRAGWRELWDDEYKRIWRVSAQFLAEDVPALRALADRWLRAFTWDRLVAVREGLLFTCLATLFLHGRALEGAPQPLRDAARPLVERAFDASRWQFRLISRAERQVDRVGREACLQVGRDALERMLDALEELRRGAEAVAAGPARAGRRVAIRSGAARNGRTRP